MGSNEAYDVFLSYARTDEVAAAELNDWLLAQGFSTFFDRRELRPGLRWVPALEDAIARSRAVAILVGRHGIGNTQQYETELALVRQTSDNQFRVIPVLMPDCDNPPTGFLQLRTWVDLRNSPGVRDRVDGLEVLRAGILGRPPVATDARKLAPSIRESICPYRGLEAFREEDAPFFCGRDDAIRDLVAHVQEHNFVAVIGPSASGKSSLVFAGLLPAIRKQRRATMWDAVTLRPGKWPLRALAAAFGTPPVTAGAPAVDTWLEGETAALRAADKDILVRIIDQRLDATPEKPDRLLVYIDQWEELYAIAPAAEDKERAKQHSADVEKFITLLVSASGSGSRAKVVLTVRSDFYNPLIRNPLLAALLPKQQVNIPPMSRDDLRSAIERPAKMVGLSFVPPALVDRILDDVGLEEGRFPLLQFALKETWQMRNGDKLTADAYVAVGGVAYAMVKTAQDAYESLVPAQKEAARRLFLRLVTPGDGQEDTRARSLIPDDPQQREIINLFANPKTRLLVTGYDTLQGTMRAGSEVRSTVEVAHGALIQRWPMLREWVGANRENMRARAAILRAQKEWEENGESERFLLDPGVQLERGRALLANPGDVPVDDIRDYVTGSIQKDQRRLEAEQARSRKRRYYVSYAWADASDSTREDKVDAFCMEAEARGIEVFRDKTKLKTGGRISIFMREIGLGDRVFVFVSDKYLKSVFCMKELFEMWRNSRQNEADFTRQVRVITLGDAKIWDIDGRLEYAGYWDEKYQKLSVALEGRRATLLADADIQSFRLMGDFAHHVGNILFLFADSVQPKTFDEFVQYGFNDLPEPSPGV